MFKRLVDRMVRVHVDNKLERLRIVGNNGGYASSGWVFATVSFLGFTMIFPITKCIGNSMSPTIDKGGDIALTDKFSHLIARMPYEVGEVVISISPTNKDKNICKRIRAVEGQYVIYRDSYRIARIIRIPPKHVWLQGDNPSDSTDSRKYGPVSTELIVSRVVKKLEDFDTLPRTFEYLSLDIERDDHSYTLDDHSIPKQYRDVVNHLTEDSQIVEPPVPLFTWLWNSIVEDLFSDYEAFKKQRERQSQEQSQEQEDVDELLPQPVTNQTVSREE